MADISLIGVVDTSAGIGQSELVRLFDPDSFVQSCIEALSEHDPADAIRELTQRAVSDPRSFEVACPVPVDASDDGIIHRSDDIMVCHAIFPRRFQTGIHNHGVEAIIGVWSGYEDNHLFEETGHALRSIGPRRVEAGQVLVLGADAIHDVHTPVAVWSGALHVYLGDISRLPRTAWSSAAGPASAFDGEQQHRQWTEVALATGLVVDPARTGTHT